MPEGVQGMGRRFAEETGTPPPPRRKFKLRDQPLRRRRCEEHARKGTGTGMCDHWLDEHGQCVNASNHLENLEGDSLPL